MMLIFLLQYIQPLVLAMFGQTALLLLVERSHLDLNQLILTGLLQQLHPWEVGNNDIIAVFQKFVI